MKSLYINTTEKNLILGFKDGEKFLVSESGSEHQQSEIIFSDMEKILDGNKVSDLDFIVCLGGPGAFTGIRLGLSIVKGFNIALGVPVITLNNFMASFYSLPKQKDDFYIAISSGMNELFVSKFSPDGNVLEEGKLVKKEEFNPDCKVFLNLKINPEMVLLHVEKNFDKEKFVQEEIKPTYIKPHYAKVKAK